MPAAEDCEIDSEAQKSEKRATRKRILDALHRLPDRDRRSAVVCELLENEFFLDKSGFSSPNITRTAFVYAGVAPEVLTLPLISRVLRDARLSTQWTLAAPRCFKTDLRFFALLRLEDLRPGRFGILEPPVDTPEDRRKTPREGDVIIVPGVAFTERGIRLGRGAGFYDRFLAAVPANVPKIGLAFDAQLVPDLPEGPFDVRMDFVISESGVIRCNRPQSPKK